MYNYINMYVNQNLTFIQFYMEKHKLNNLFHYILLFILLMNFHKHLYIVIYWPKSQYLI